MVRTRDLRDAIELAYFGLAELDSQERFVKVNPAYLSMLGLRETDEDKPSVLEAYGHFWLPN